MEDAFNWASVLKCIRSQRYEGQSRRAEHSCAFMFKVRFWVTMGLSRGRVWRRPTWCQVVTDFNHKTSYRWYYSEIVTSALRQHASGRLERPSLYSCRRRAVLLHLHKRLKLSH